MADLLVILRFIPRGIFDSHHIYNKDDLPRITLNKYCRVVYKKIICSRDILMRVFLYMSLYSEHVSLPINNFIAYKLFLTASIVAHKFWSVDVYKNIDMSVMFNIPVDDINIMEMDFLKGIRWKLYKLPMGIDKDVFDFIVKHITGIEYTHILNEYNNIKQKKETIKKIQLEKHMHTIINTIINQAVELSSKTITIS